MKELTVLSDLMPRHMFDFNSLGVEAKPWVQVWHFRVSPFLSGLLDYVWLTITLHTACLILRLLSCLQHIETVGSSRV